MYLRKVFENIVRLEFDKSDVAVGMISAENEVVTLRNFLIKGGTEVEEWFKNLEEQMKFSLKIVFRNSLLKYE